MGWLFNMDPSFGKADLVRELTSPGYWGPCLQILKHSLVGNHLWCAAERTKEDGSRERFIALFLLRSGGPRGGWGYKVLTESMGPAAVDCPLSFFDLVPPLEGEEVPEYARDWREKVRAYHAEKAARRKRCAEAVPGLVVSFDGHDYKLIEPILSLRWSGEGKERRRTGSWIVRRISDGMRFKMSAAVLGAALAAPPSPPAPNTAGGGLG